MQQKEYENLKLSKMLYVALKGHLGDLSLRMNMEFVHIHQYIHRQLLKPQRRKVYQYILVGQVVGLIDRLEARFLFRFTDTFVIRMLES